MQQSFVDSFLTTKAVVSLSTLAVLFLRQGDPYVSFFILGALLNAIWSKLLKKLFKNHRPEEAKDAGYSDHGMPSSHSQTLFFYTSCLYLEFTNPAKIPLWTRDPRFATAAIIAFGLFATVSSLWRAHKGFHTYPQVLVGAAVGTLFGVIFYIIVVRFMEREYVRFIQPLPMIIKFAMLFLLLGVTTVILNRSLQRSIITAVRKRKEKKYI